MISICTVILNRLQSFLDINIESICEKLKLVKEVLIYNVEEDASYNKNKVIAGKTFKYIGCKDNVSFRVNSVFPCAQHAVGLHLAIDQANSEFVWLSDPDIFFYDAVDEIFLDLIKTYNLNCIGIAHKSAITEAFGFFPTVANLMVKKKDLPGKTYLEKEFILADHLELNDEKFESKLPGKYLFPGKANISDDLYYNPKGHFETGCNLIPWVIEQNWRWLAFQTLDCSNYNTINRRSQPKLNIKLPKRRLLYHSGEAAAYNKITSFSETYKEFKKEVNHE